LKPIRIEQKGAVTSVWYEQSHGGFDFMLSSDRHHDSIACDRDLEKKHLDEALRREALIIDAGDLFDCMQGKFDPRKNYDELRPEYKVERYYDAVLDDCAKFYMPYKDNFLVVGKGNHETAVLKYASTDMTSRLVDRLRQAGSNVVGGGYGGWVVLYFGTNAGSRSSIRLRYFHGAGGEAPVTRGIIQTNRQAVYLPDADIVLNGHSHNEYTLSIKRERISTKGAQYFDMVHFARTPGYKDDYGTGVDGWEVQRGMVPKPRGCIWLRIEVHRKDCNHKPFPQCYLTADVI
jgi:hypothetical protein